MRNDPEFAAADRSRGRIARIAPALIVALGAVIAFVQSDRRWLDPIIDTGRDLYIADALAHGARLYRDIRYQYPPLAPYLLAPFTRVTGGSLTVFATIGALSAVVIACALLRTGRVIAGPVAGAVGALLFVTLNFAGASTFGCNFLFPYSYAATFGVMFYLVYVAATIGYLLRVGAARDGERTNIARARPALLWLALAAGALASWCKLEYAFAVTATLILLTLFRFIPWRAALGFAAVNAAMFAAAQRFFRAAPGYDWLRDNLLAASLTRGESARHFFAMVSGTDRLAEHAAAAFLGALTIAVCCWLLRRFEQERGTVARVVIALLLLLCGSTLASGSFFRAWAVLQLAALLWAMLRDRRDLLLPLAAFSIAATVRVALNTTPAWYGFTLVIPLYLLIVYVLFEYLPARGIYTRRTALLWLPLFAWLMLHGLYTEHLAWSEKRFAVATARGTFFDWNDDRARVLAEFLAYVRQRPASTLAVMPEGATLNYLAGTPTPLSFHTFTPVEIAAADVEAQIVAELLARRPARIAIVTRDVREYGFRGFGIDYALHIRAVLGQHYVVERVWSKPRFSLTLLRLRN
jgi:hypothetical protein